MIITIDGPAGSGKSTTADVLAEKLGFLHFNSGSLYRGITAHLLNNNFDFNSLKELTQVPDFLLNVKMIEGTQHVFVNNIDYSPILRDNEISTLVALVAANRFCRNKVDECQKEFCSQCNVVTEGRDLGSFVFPNADFKFYLDCSVEERARRRFNEEKAKNSHLTLEDIKNQIIERDNIDKNRTYAPLVIPQNSIIIDSTHMTVEEVVNTMIKIIKNS